MRQFARNTWLIVAHTERKATLLYMLPNLDRRGQSNFPSPPGKFPALPLKSWMIGDFIVSQPSQSFPTNENSIEIKHILDCLG